MGLRFKRDARGRRLHVLCDAEPTLPFLGAACLLTEKACVVVGRSGQARAALLTPRGRVTLAALEKEFALAYRNQLARWRLIQAVGPAAAPPAESFEAAVGTLSKEHRAEIARLLAEPEIVDTLGIKGHWEDRRA